MISEQQRRYLDRFVARARARDELPDGVFGVYRRSSIDRRERVLKGVSIKTKGRRGAAVRVHMLKMLGDGQSS